MEKQFATEITMEIAEDQRDRRMPLVMKIIGVLLILSGLLLVPYIVVVVIGSGVGVTEGAFADDSILSFILYWILVAAAAYVVFGFVFLGVRLVRGNRRRARLLAESVAIGLLVAFGSDFMLEGRDAAMWPLLVATIMIIVADVVVDPALSDERRLQHQLRLMETRDDAEEGTLGLDKTGQGYIQLDFFNIFWIFVVASIIGVVIETIYHALVVDFGHYQDRAGLLFGPFSPIYGFGAVLMTLALNRFHKAPVWVIFLVSAVIGGAFEYFVSCFMEYCFGAVAWDYTGTFLNINGRTNFMFMCMWGALGVMWMRWALPTLLNVINLIPWQWRYTITAVCTALMVADCLMTLVALDCWYSRLSGLEPNNALEWFCAQHFDNTWMENRFESMSIHPDTAHR
ncbi:MAG: putative ABC transporter permease [Eggerthellaceae bacterium]|nr:putative ABC transporter permease [Eggerthellaceae bacterium]